MPSPAARPAKSPCLSPFVQSIYQDLACENSNITSYAGFVMEQHGNLRVGTLEGFGFIEIDGLLPGNGIYSVGPKWYKYYEVMKRVSWYRHFTPWATEQMKSTSGPGMDLASSTIERVNTIIDACKHVNGLLANKLLEKRKTGLHITDQEEKFRQAAFIYWIVRREGQNVKISNQGIVENEGTLVMSGDGLVVMVLKDRQTGEFCEEFERCHLSLASFEKGTKMTLAKVHGSILTPEERQDVSIEEFVEL